MEKTVKKFDFLTEHWYYKYPEFWELFNGLEKDAKIVDAGCGKSATANKLLERGFKNIILLDIEDQRVFEETKKLPFFRADLNRDRWPFDDGSINCVVATEIIEHLENPWFFTREIHRVLKPGGRLILSTPNTWNIMSRLLFLKKGMLECFGHNFPHHLWSPNKELFEIALKNFRLLKRFYNQRERLYFFGLCLKIKLPRDEFWGMHTCYLFEKLPR